MRFYTNKSRNVIKACTKQIVLNNDLKELRVLPSRRDLTRNFLCHKGLLQLLSTALSETSSPGPTFCNYQQQYEVM